MQKYIMPLQPYLSYPSCLLTENVLLHLSVNYNVLSDMLSGFQTRILFVARACIGNFFASSPVKYKTAKSSNLKTQSDLRDRRNLGIPLTFIHCSPCSRHDLQCLIYILLCACGNSFSRSHFYPASSSQKVGWGNFNRENKMLSFFHWCWIA